MISPRPTHHRQRLLARVACMACRRLKMKCIGAEDSPCQRCCKAGRECVFPNINSRPSVPHAQSSGYSQQSSHNGPGTNPRPGNGMLNETSYDDDMLDRGSATEERNASASQSNEKSSSVPHHDHNQNATSPATAPNSQRVNPEQDSSNPLPSVYSVAPVDLVNPFSATNSPHGTSSAAENTSVTAPSTVETPSQSTKPPKSIDDQHIFDLVVFFNEKLLHNLPFLTDDTTRDIPNLIRTKRPLAYCAAFVAARFVPGYNSVREDIVPEIMHILDQRYCPPGNGLGQAWTLLQAFSVLYAYATTQSSDVTNDSCLIGGLSHWALKSTVEMFAGRLELHRSAEVLRASLKTGTNIDNQSTELRRYVLWLWIFTMSHYSSLLLRAPPTVIVDDNIKSAGKLLGNLNLDAIYLRIVAEVELCLLWHHSTTFDQVASEWWCSSSAPANIENTLATLERFENAIEVWRERWLPQPPSSSLGHRPNASVVFHYRFTRFCVSTYVTRLTYQRGEVDSHCRNSKCVILPSVIPMVLQSIDAAIDLCSVIPSLSPLQRDNARYLADTAFSMVAFPCFYIIRAAEMLPQSATVSMESKLRSVEVVANTMMGLAVDAGHGASVYAKIILEKLTAYQSREMQKVASANVDHSSNQDRFTATDLVATRAEPSVDTSMSTRDQSGFTGGNDFEQDFDNLDWAMPTQQHQFYPRYNNWSVDASIESSADMMAAFNGAWALQNFE